MESYSSCREVTFAALQTRLIRSINQRIRNGEFTERGLARVIGISQPQIHNVLKGARKLGPELADRLLCKLQLDLLDLVDGPELREHLTRRRSAVVTYTPDSTLVGE